MPTLGSWALRTEIARLHPSKGLFPQHDPMSWGAHLDHWAPHLGVSSLCMLGASGGSHCTQPTFEEQGAELHFPDFFCVTDSPLLLCIYSRPVGLYFMLWVVKAASFHLLQYLSSSGHGNLCHEPLSPGVATFPRTPPVLVLPDVPRAPRVFPDGPRTCRSSPGSLFQRRRKSRREHRSSWDVTASRPLGSHSNRTQRTCTSVTTPLRTICVYTC